MQLDISKLENGQLYIDSGLEIIEISVGEWRIFDSAVGYSNFQSVAHITQGGLNSFFFSEESGTKLVLAENLEREVNDFLFDYLFDGTTEDDGGDSLKKVLEDA